MSKCPHCKKEVSIGDICDKGHEPIIKTLRKRAEKAAFTIDIHRIDALYLCGLIDYLTAENKIQSEKMERLEKALIEIRDAETECCSRCEGNGRLYADGKAHYIAENAPTIACPNCLGEGRLPGNYTRDIAEQTLEGSD